MIFNATYNPRGNPIEEVFGILKSKIRHLYDTNPNDLIDDVYEVL